MGEGALTYHDWTELVLEEVPGELTGNVLLTTVRGRAREAHLLGAFRQTPFPSSENPDHLALTWSGDPATTQTIQWRAGRTVERGVVQYKPKQAADAPWQTVAAEKAVIKDRLLANDPVCHRFTAALTNLEPGTAYVYRVGVPDSENWSSEAAFTTAPASPEPFTFVYIGDTHSSPYWARMLETPSTRHPETSFNLLRRLPSGGRGRALIANEWTIFFGCSRRVTGASDDKRVDIGNMDQDWLGARDVRRMFIFHKTVPPKRASGCSPIEYACLFESLSRHPWRPRRTARGQGQYPGGLEIVMFHSPPYATHGRIPGIRARGSPFRQVHVGTWSSAAQVPSPVRRTA